MKQLIAFICILSLCGCAQYTQMYFTTSPLKQDDKNCFVYENDTIKVQYYFWQENGVLAFVILNKLDKPLYIDWKKSSFVKSDYKFDYWIDEQSSEKTSIYTSALFNKVLSGWDIGKATIGVLAGKSKTVKPERITFIAPHSKIYRSTFTLFTSGGVTLPKTIPDTIMDINGHSSGPAYLAFFKKVDAPLIFRNFLTLSTSEKFESESYVDNEFYVNRIIEMKRDGFDLKSGYNFVIIPCIYENPSAFFVNINGGTAINDR